MEYGDEDFIAWMADLIEQQELEVTVQGLSELLQLEDGQEKEEDHDN